MNGSIETKYGFYNNQLRFNTIQFDTVFFEMGEIVRRISTGTEIGKHNNTYVSLVHSKRMMATKWQSSRKKHAYMRSFQL